VRNTPTSNIQSNSFIMSTGVMRSQLQGANSTSKLILATFMHKHFMYTTNKLHGCITQTLLSIVSSVAVIPFNTELGPKIPQFPQYDPFWDHKPNLPHSETSHHSTDELRIFILTRNSHTKVCSSFPPSITILLQSSLSQLPDNF
jgi:hypothetical protein